MAFFSKLLDALVGVKPMKETTSDQLAKGSRKNITYQDPWLTIHEPYFHGHGNYSPNQRWIVGFRDSDGVSTGGMRENGNGAVVLVDIQKEQVLHAQGHFARPVAALVSDTGNYILHDSGFGVGLKGDLIACNIAGKETYRRHFEANIISIGLSQNGRYAVTQTANAPNSIDGNLLELVDLEHKAVLFSENPISGWANTYAFEIDASGVIKKLYVDLQMGRFAYSSAGEFLDKKDYLNARLTKGDFTSKLFAAQELLQLDSTEEGAQKALCAADEALVDQTCDHPHWRAIAYRVRGECFELLGQPAQALVSYEHALNLNPKVGVKKRMTSLRKSSSQ
ncbi:tetratricopeptide repeat protein [Undibacterium sp. TC4M20W]|uniref:tetratricopeptide repeat protein n=1 Tax=Undibacterium sp. TC4M20W TaxID=3413052 RepID=UPI003BF18367